MAAALDRSDPAATLVIVSSKSGGTVETFSLFKVFYDRACRALDAQKAGAGFVAITDPGSALSETGARLGFRKVFLADPDVGGRYSALIHFGLVPAALAGIDLDELVARAGAAAAACRREDPRENPGCNSLHWSSL